MTRQGLGFSALRRGTALRLPFREQKPVMTPICQHNCGFLTFSGPVLSGLWHFLVHACVCYALCSGNPASVLGRAPPHILIPFVGVRTLTFQSPWKHRQASDYAFGVTGEFIFGPFRVVS